MIDRDWRAVHALRHDRSGTVFQPWPTTFEDRYPDVFAALADRLAPIDAPRILSFGCSDGAEVRALRAAIPRAFIQGIDVNPRQIAKARARDPHPLSRYAVAACPPAGEPFDAVLAMAVFRHGALEADMPDDCSAVMPFARVARGVEMLDAVVRPGGVLAIAHAHFAFEDQPLAHRYTAEMSMLDPPGEPALVYGPDNRRKSPAPGRGVLFRKNLRSVPRS